MYRPEEYEDMSLHDWFRLSRKATQNRKNKKKQDWIDEETVNDDELNLFETADDLIAEEAHEEEDNSQSEVDVGPKEKEQEQEAEQGQDIQNDDLNNDDELNIGDNESPVESVKEKHDCKYFDFLEEHPLHETHHVYCVDEKHAKVPNFLGGSLPRPDSGDREYYCSVMLTLFVPWRTEKISKQRNNLGMKVSQLTNLLAATMISSGFSISSMIVWMLEKTILLR
jgi:hypothetical protein